MSDIYKMFSMGGYNPERALGEIYGRNKKKVVLKSSIEEFIDYMNTLADIFPCLDCRNHIEEYYESNNIKNYLNHENHLLTQTLINEAIINDKIFEVYDLTQNDKEMVLAKEGESIGGLPVSVEARDAYVPWYSWI